MKYVSKSITRFGYRQVLKVRKSSPTIFVVSGVVGLGATTVMAGIATRKLEPILENHAKQRIEIRTAAINEKEEKKRVVNLYKETAIDLGMLYGPTVVLGTLSAVSVLHGHRILRGRNIATMAAYSGLMEQYQAYRNRVSETVGPELEREIHEGAVGEWKEDPNHKGEYKMEAKYGEPAGTYLRPFFDEANDNWTTDPTSNYLFLKAVQSHMNRKFELQGHLFLFEVYDALGMPRPRESIVTGWLANSEGDGFIDFGFMTDSSPEAAMFRNGAERSVRLNFNIDGVIWDLI